MVTIDKQREFSAVGFGEVMLRLSPSGKERISQGETFEKRAGGSELNVVSGISMLGLRTGLITKLPDNEIGKFVKNQVRFCGVSDDCVVYDTSDDARLGVYYYEGGVYPRRPSVVYDRKASSINTLSVEEIDPAIYEKAQLFHTSGISLALSPTCRSTALEVIRRFKERGTLMSTIELRCGARMRRAEPLKRCCRLWTFYSCRRNLPGGCSERPEIWRTL